MKPLSAALAAALGLVLLAPLAGLGWQPAALAVHPQEEPAAAGQDDKKPAAGRLDELVKLITDHSIKPVDRKKVNELAIKGVIEGLKDPYAAYYTPAELESFKTMSVGKLVGIGIQIKAEKDKKLTVVTPLEGSPAHKAGMRPGDVITAIDGTSTDGISLEAAVKMIIGEQGTKVTLDVVRGGEKKKFELTRALVRIATVNGFERGAGDQWTYFLDPKRKIGYIHITQFGPTTADEVEKAVGKLKGEGLKGLIVDLRHNPGGLFGTATKTADLFLPKGTIVSIQGTKEEKKEFTADEDSLGDFPVLVLINPYTASAAEIVAGALQGNQRAVLLGARTWGKGSIQSVVPLKEGGAVKLTTALHYLPGGRNIQKQPGGKTWGVDPDDGFYVPMTKKQNEELQKKSMERAVLGRKDRPKAKSLTPRILAEDYADPQLAKAVEAMTARLADGKFAKVGQPLKAQQAYAERLQERREHLQQQLRQLDKEMADLRPVPKER